MNDLELSQHAEARIKQRGLRINELDLIMLIATEVEGGFYVRKKDVVDIEHAIKRSLERLKKLPGKRLVVQGNTIVTAYHASQNDERRLLRKGQRRPGCL